MTDGLRPAIYSGPMRSGVCVCGHSWEDHHLGMVIDQSKVQTTGGPENYVPQECEFYGSNEDAGLDTDGNDHCWRYRDSALPDEHN